MSVFNKDQIQTPPTPQKYFETLCDEVFGFDFTDHGIYEYEGNDLNKRLSNIWAAVRKAYPQKMLKLEKVGFGNLKVVSVDMSCLPVDYWDDLSNYEFKVI